MHWNSVANILGFLTDGSMWKFSKGRMFENLWAYGCHIIIIYGLESKKFVQLLLPLKFSFTLYLLVHPLPLLKDWAFALSHLWCTVASAISDPGGARPCGGGAKYHLSYWEIPLVVVILIIVEKHCFRVFRIHIISLTTQFYELGIRKCDLLPETAEK